jgi:hypothetical protein
MDLREAAWKRKPFEPKGRSDQERDMEREQIHNFLITVTDFKVFFLIYSFH